MKWKVCDWEDNGYHDSYFYVAIWDDEAKQLEDVQYASTAFGGGRSFGEWPSLRDAPADVRSEF